MKRIFMTLVSVLFAFLTVGAQNDMYLSGKNKVADKDKSVEVVKRAEEKALQQKIDSMQFAEASQAIRDTAFTLEADEVVFKYGERAYVTPSTNFVSLKDGNAVIQISFNIPVAGPNGMGGITVNGSMNKYNVKTDKRGNVQVSFYVMGTVANCQVNIMLYNGSNKATITLFPTFSSNNLTLDGVILPNEKSFVVQGRTI